MSDQDRTRPRGRRGRLEGEQPATPAEIVTAASKAENAWWRHGAPAGRPEQPEDRRRRRRERQAHREQGEACEVGPASHCAFCQEPFSKQRPAGEIVLRLPVGEDMATFTTAICMACVRRMMGDACEKTVEPRGIG